MSESGQVDSDNHTSGADWLTRVAKVFAAGGDLAKGNSHFRARPGQQRMAELVAQAIANENTLVVEAGTGTGKTYAYLAPASALLHIRPWPPTMLFWSSPSASS